MTETTEAKAATSKAVATDVAALLRSRSPLLWIVTREEARVEGYLMEAAAAANYKAYTWDVGQGVADMTGQSVAIGSIEPDETLSAILERVRPSNSYRTVRPAEPERAVWIMRDLPVWLRDPKTCRLVRNLARLIPSVPRGQAQALIVLSPSGDVPPELAGHATVLEWPLPDRAEIAELLDAAIQVLPEDMKETAAPNGARDQAIDAAVGLSGEEAQACYARSLVQLRRIDPTTVALEKKRIITRERVLEWYDPLPGGLDAVGGLDQLKAWLVQRRLAYSSAARAYGLPAPKGAMLVGISGCGKSLTAKAIATAWGIPLLKVDLGALKSKFVGDSRTAFLDLEDAAEIAEPATVGRAVDLSPVPEIAAPALAARPAFEME